MFINGTQKNHALGLLLAKHVLCEYLQWTVGEAKKLLTKLGLFQRRLFARGESWGLYHTDDRIFLWRMENTQVTDSLVLKEIKVSWFAVKVTFLEDVKVQLNWVLNPCLGTQSKCQHLGPVVVFPFFLFL